MKDFNDLYYESVDCIRCNLCLDKCPVVRAAGIDKAPLYASVYTAMGSRFDLDMTSKDAYQCIDCYECNAVCPVEVPIAETMLHVKHLAIAANKISDTIKNLTAKAKNGQNILGNPLSLKGGKADVALFLGYAGELDQNVIDAFDKICKAANIKYSVIAGAADSGYFLDRSGFEEAAKNAVEANVKLFKEADAKVVVTPDSFAYEAFVSMYPKDMKYKHISQFVAELMAKGKLNFKADNNMVVYHDPHFLTRVNGVESEPRSIIKAISGQVAVEPIRTGAKTSASGIGGGLGLFQEDIMEKVSQNRAGDLAKLGCDTVVSGCVFEKYALKDALVEKNVKVLDITEYVAQAI